MATDDEIRGRLLSFFYQCRHNADGWVPTSEMNLAGMESIDRQVVSSVCQHLSEAGLIQWKPLVGSNEGAVVGMARITGLGVDVIDGRKIPSISVTLPSQRGKLTGVEAKGTATNLAETPIGMATTVETSRSKSIDVQLEQDLSVEKSVNRATVPIVPTLYPGDPSSGTIVVHNFITINCNSAEFHEFTAKINELTGELRQSNEIGGEVRDKLLAEIAVGLSILKSPKPDPTLIDLFLKRPLAYLADRAGGAIIGTLATAALLALGKVTGLF